MKDIIGIRVGDRIHITTNPDRSIWEEGSGDNFGIMREYMGKYLTVTYIHNDECVQCKESVRWWWFPEMIEEIIPQCKPIDTSDLL